MKRILQLICLPFLLFVSNLNAQNTVIYVNQAATGANNGSSWANAYTSLQTALTSDLSFTDVWVAKGTYYPSSSNGLPDSPRYYNFKINNLFSNIYGGFAGTETSVSQRVNYGFNEANETILSGDIGIKGDNSDNCYRVVNLNGGNPDFVMDGFTIRDGNANGSDPYNKGGGMYEDHPGLTLSNITFYNNSASLGGGIYANNIWLSGSIATVKNSQFINNHADDKGGGLYAESTSQELLNCRFDGNDASYTTTEIIGTNLIITKYGKGGGVCFQNSTSRLDNVLINNCNVKVDGGGVYYSGGSHSIVNSTIVGNSAEANGGGICCNDATSVLDIRNSILWYNGASLGSQLYQGAVNIKKSCFSDKTNDFIGSTETVTNCININPRFSNPNNKDYRISGHSPCLNAGDSTFIHFQSGTYKLDITQDLRGKKRVQGTQVDMGAYEWTSVTDTYSTIFVNKNATGLNDGTDWSNAFTSLQSALDGYLAGDEIWVAKGVYYPSSTVDIVSPTARDKHFRITEGMKLYGGFGGSEYLTSQRSNFGINLTNETRLSGDIGTLGDNSDNCYHVIYNPAGTNLTNNTLLDGFTIFGGNANGTTTRSTGGGVLLNGCSPLMQNISFYSNSASLGGGLYNDANSNPTIVNTNFKLNTATTSGGAVYNNVSSPQFFNALFLSNSAVTQGGAVENVGVSTPKFMNSTFTLNSANVGGGMYNLTNASPTLNNSILWDNTATSGGNQIYNSSGTTTLNYSCYSNGTNDIFNAGTFTATNHNITSDPTFLDDLNENYRLPGNSLCVNTGNNTYNLYDTDLRGNARIQNTTIDMGAYEWTSGSEPASRIIYVNTTRVDDSGNGLTWANAKKTLQAALTSVLRQGDQIWIAKGTYFPTSSNGLTNTPRYYHFAMVEGTAIYGGFAGTETSIDQRTNFSFGGANETILSGDIGTVGDNTDNCYHVIYNRSAYSALTNATMLNGVTITGGNANGATFYDRGAGIYCNTTSPTFSNIVVTGNSAIYGGGANNYSSTAVYSNCLFFDNTASDTGGGMNNWLSNITVTNCTFSSNTATNSGGGIINQTSSPTFNNCIVWGNTAPLGGEFNNTVSGGVSKTVTLNNSCYYNGTGAINNSTISAATITFKTTNNNTTQDPLFIDVLNHNYRIYRSSPAFNTGNNIYNSGTQDIGGRTRIEDDIIDMGAYEWTLGTDRLSVNPRIYVNKNATGSKIGTSWANAITNLDYGIMAAQKGDSVWVAKGTYKPNSAHDLNNTPNNYHFKLRDGFALCGGFSGTESSIKQRINFGLGGLNETILSGDLNDDDIVSGSDSTPTITNTSDNCNHVIYSGSDNFTTALTIDGFTIKGGNSSDNGSAIYRNCAAGHYDSPLTLRNMNFTANSASAGGALYCLQTPATIIENSSFISNVASSYGGAIYFQSSTPNDNLSVSNTLFKSNRSNNYGGAVYYAANKIALFTNVVFLSNYARLYGGALQLSVTGKCTFTNTVFTQNFANTGGAIYCVGGTMNFYNSIIWGNNAKTAKQLFNYTNNIVNSCYSNQTNDISGTVVPVNCINTDPKFINALGGDVRLFGNSPCVNTGVNSYNTLAFDIRGQNRIQNTTIDMGAYEWTSGVDPLNNLTTGFENNIINPEISVYPNPSTDVINFRFKPQYDGKTTLDILTLTGQVVYRAYEGNAEKGMQQAIQFTKPLAEGLYIYKLTNGSLVKTGQLIRMKRNN